MKHTISHILSIEFTVDEFFELVTGNDSCLELEFVKEAFDNIEIVGNFVASYINMIDEYFRVELESKVRSKILKKYPIRRKNIENQEEKEEENTDIEDDEE